MRKRTGLLALSVSAFFCVSAAAQVQTEVPAVVPFSWHKPKRPLYILSTSYCPNLIFNNAMDMVSFVDGHASYIKLFYDATLGPAPFAYTTPQIPGSYNYQNGPD